MRSLTILITYFTLIGVRGELSITSGRMHIETVWVTMDYPVWVEVGVVDLHLSEDAGTNFTSNPRSKESGEGLCPLSEPHCQPQGAVRVSCGRIVVEPYAYLSRKTSESKLSKLSRISSWAASVPMGCQACYSPCCQECDWAASEIVQSSNLTLASLIQSVEKAAWRPSNTSISFAFLLSVNGSSVDEFNYPSFPCSAMMLSPEEQISPCPVTFHSLANLSQEVSKGLYAPIVLEMDEDTNITCDTELHDTNSYMEGRTLDDTWKDRSELLELETLGRARSLTASGLGSPMKAITASYFSPIASVAPPLIAQELAKAIVKPINQLTKDAVGSHVTEMATEFVTNRAWVMVLNPVTDAVVDATTRQVSHDVAAYVYDNINIDKQESEVIARRVTQRAIERILPAATSRAAVGVANAVTRKLVQTLTKGLTHSVVGSVLTALSRSPLQDYYCYYCSYYDKYCEYCAFTPRQLYFALYYAGYYSTWYAHYYAHPRKPPAIKTTSRWIEDYLDEIEYTKELLDWRSNFGTHLGKRFWPHINLRNPFCTEGWCGQQGASMYQGTG